MVLKKYQQKSSGKTLSREELKANTQGKGLVKAIVVVLVLILCLGMAGFYIYNRYLRSYHQKAITYYDKAVEYKEGFDETVDKIDQGIEDVRETKKKVEEKWTGLKNFVDKFAN